MWNGKRSFTPSFAPGRVIQAMQTAQNLQIDISLEKVIRLDTHAFGKRAELSFLGQIYKVCESKDMVPEMVWVRSRMGDNKGALYLIIDRLETVDRVGSNPSVKRRGKILSGHRLLPRNVRMMIYGTISSLFGNKTCVQLKVSRERQHCDRSNPDHPSNFEMG